MADRRGQFDRDWIGGKVQRFVVPLPAVPTCERKRRLAEDRDFYAALLMCYAPYERELGMVDLWQRADTAYRRMERDK